ncbi:MULTISPECIES: thiamine pyrophosphate-requiring protein [Microbacterium]|uniref:Thiamine pyrophosphate-requiring protein n=1 Tax=Microbacterium wangchenii TaxID=2541726 RepID=A0ABX5SVV5_9MICO|nr:MULTISPECIES: thiamine pyrophosphate-requiring protein [Microbacterium]MCK6067811.1 thiamine pyrophosphate-requiring protein [Microbacterium sp. EYE_512]QBR89287.1 thiamine pyrophosphate-requiring protein [Microbacterium wangchenii]TXK10960.1 thiamine pyrophosphate-requiring protein [Microbacterium wangchenii]
MSADQATVSDVIVERLRAWGVERVYGYSGDGINGVMDALRRADPKIAFVQARHEENAAFMAVGEAKFAGRVGVVMSTQGPGAVHLLNGLYDAKLDHVPVVAIVGQQRRSALGSGYMQEIDLRALMGDVASAFLGEASDPAQIPMLVDRAFRSALARRAPAVVIVPHDVQVAPADPPRHAHGVVHTSAVFESGSVAATDDQLQRAVDVLAGAERPVILAGAGARGCRDVLSRLAERMGAAIVTSLRGKTFVDEAHPLCAGTLGHLGTTASADVLEACDALLIVGANDPWTEYYPAPGQARAVQIDIDPAQIGNRYPVEVPVVSDAHHALVHLLARIPQAQDASWGERVRDRVARWHRIAARRAEVPMRGVNPEHAVRALRPHVASGMRVALDVGSVVYAYARQLVVPSDVDVHLSSTLASMGCGVPYGLAAKLSDPARPVLVLAGDGGMQMTGLNEMLTVAARWRDWRDPRFVVAVLDNRDLAEVSWEQREMESAPRFRESQELPAVDYAAYARLLGLDGVTAGSPDEVEEAWTRAFAAERPCVVHLRTDPAAPLVPPSQVDVAQLWETLRAEADAGGEHGRAAVELLDAYLAIDEEER